MGSDCAALKLGIEALEISIHAPRVGSDSKILDKIEELSISIHAPRVGSDTGRALVKMHWIKFQSTLPVWGATGTISYATYLSTDFNPRSPCGERRVDDFILIRIFYKFQSTLPVWGATIYSKVQISVSSDISIHAPRVGSDTFLLQWR